ncbi:hypothetical protein A2U01_0023724 [Trifolium medium]|uniref:Uncharacterized protein n=1 Tax=Trifolium medium TaxID=97028 RepID=A0A392NTZ2_9FABA|nr:hypothetical protein [Trifolium medium]
MRSLSLDTTTLLHLHRRFSKMRRTTTNININSTIGKKSLATREKWRRIDDGGVEDGDDEDSMKI